MKIILKQKNILPGKQMFFYQWKGVFLLLAYWRVLGKNNFLNRRKIRISVEIMIIRSSLNFTIIRWSNQLMKQRFSF